MKSGSTLHAVVASVHRAWSSLSDGVRTVAAIFAFRFALDLAYATAIAPRWGYMALDLDPSLGRYIESIVVLGVMTAVFLKLSPRESASRLILAVLLLLALVPVSTLYGLTDATRSTFYLIVMSFIITTAVANVPIRLPRPPRGAPLATVLFCGVMVAATSVWILSQGALAILNLDFADVYDYREQASALLNVGVWQYLVAWSFRVFSVALLVYALLKRRYFAVIGLAALQVAFFAVSAHKSVLFILPLLAAVILAYRTRAPERVAFWGMTLITIVGALLASVGSEMFMSLFTRRLLVVPANILFGMYDFFGSTSLVLMSNGVLSDRFEYPFPSPTPVMAGQFLYGHGNTWANGSYLGTGYMHFGIAGVIVFAIIVGLLIAFARSASAGQLPPWAKVALVIVPFVTLFSSSDLGTTILTHGLGPALIVLWLFSSYVPDSQSESTERGDRSATRKLRR